MTSNQLKYWENRERERSNRANEIETARSNRVKEIETERSNRAKEIETNRSNLVKEKETNRANLVKEAETERSNKNKEWLTEVQVAGDHPVSYAALTAARLLGADSSQDLAEKVRGNAPFNSEIKATRPNSQADIFGPSYEQQAVEEAWQSKRSRDLQNVFKGKGIAEGGFHNFVPYN